jgi:hypothetical protein
MRLNLKQLTDNSYSVLLGTAETHWRVEQKGSGLDCIPPREFCYTSIYNTKTNDILQVVEGSNELGQRSFYYELPNDELALLEDLAKYVWSIPMRQYI